MTTEEIFEALEEEFDVIDVGPPWPVDIDERIKLQKYGGGFAISKKKYLEIKKRFTQKYAVDDLNDMLMEMEDN